MHQSAHIHTRFPQVPRVSPQRRLWVRASLAILAVANIVLIACGSFLIYDNYRKARAATDAEVKAHALFAAESIADPFWKLQRVSVRKILVRFGKRDKHALYVTQKGEFWDGVIRADVNQEMFYRRMENADLLALSNRGLAVRQNIIRQSSDGVEGIIGELWVVPDFGEIQQRAFKSATELFWQLLILDALLATASAYVIYRITRPIRRLSEVALELSQGNFQVRFPVTRQDEIGACGTAFNSMAEALGRFTSSLQQMVDEQTEVIKERTDDLIESEKTASYVRVVQGFAHELSTPLLSALTSAQMIVDAAKSILEDPQASTTTKNHARFILEMSDSSLLATLNQAADHLSTLKKVSLENSTEEREHLDLSRHVFDICKSLEPDVIRAGHHLNIHIEPGIMSHNKPGLFFHILGILIRNSCSHAFDQGQKGVIYCSLQRDSTTPSLGRLVVSDNGRGLPEESHLHAFDLYYKKSSGGSHSSFGLYSVKRMASDPKELAGDVTCTVRPGGGVVFTVEFPLNPQDIRTLPPASS
jgi:two-component system, NtrC family, sensor kinase